ncbi:lactonase family protein [Dyadobacter arcticus]|uniref:6-phosphogluconolactonase n=1 Tax=Dyadobacter arcticus TaxID=1078754 RepID=A0ABX0UJG2_9BACT|nr:lactonase family protein [Dyadobacter arcticus]NIJ53066.1 6-phosphogluconolactonase [Dyadobacter arcticus]
MRLTILTFICFLSAIMAFAQKSTKEILYVGTYTQKGEGIYVYELDRKDYSVKEIQVLTSKTSPSFLEFHPNKKFLYAANEGNNTVTSFAIDPATGTLKSLNAQPSLGRGPCHVSIDPKGRFLYVSNYGSGQLGVYLLNTDGTIGAAADSIQDKGLASQKPHMHSITPSADGKFIYASDLGIDKIMVYAVDPKTGKLTPGAVPYAEVQAGDGPRHFAIHPNGNFAYSACELTSVVNSFQIVKNTGALVPLERVTMLPEDFTGKSFAADIHFSPDGKFLYASNRGHESLAIYAVDAKTGKLTVAGHADTRGKHPRNFLIDQKGQFAIVTNKDKDNVVFFSLDKSNGQLTYSEKEISIPTPVCVKQLFLN